MHRNRKSWVCLVLVVLLIAGCASGGDKSYKGLAITAVTLDNLAGQMQAVNGVFKQKCNVEKSLTPKQCNGFVDFGEKFKKLYPSAVGLWKSSRTVSDTAVQGQADAVVNSLITELVKWGSVVGYDVLTQLKK